VHLVNDIDLILSGLWSVSYLVYEVSDTIHGVVGSGIQLMDVHGAVIDKAQTGVAFIACFKISGYIFTVYCLGQDPGTGSFSNTSWSTKKKSLGQMMILDGIFKCGCDVALADDRFEIGGPVLPRRYNKIFHALQVKVFEIKMWNVKNKIWNCGTLLETGEDSFRFYHIRFQPFPVQGCLK
jgi:hypothetical protein